MMMDAGVGWLGMHIGPGFFSGEPSLHMGIGGMGPYNLVQVQLSLGFGGHLFFVFFSKACSACDMNLL